MPIGAHDENKTYVENFSLKLTKAFFFFNSTKLFVTYKTNFFLDVYSFILCTLSKKKCLGGKVMKDLMR